MDAVSLPMFKFGAGAMKNEGHPVTIQFANCEATFWLKALDVLVIEKFAQQGIDLTALFRPTEDANTQEVRPDATAIIQQNVKAYRMAVEELVVKWEGLKRSDGSIIECSAENLGRLAGYPEVILVLIVNAFNLAREIEKNLPSSSDGSTTQIEPSDGEPTSATANEQE